MSNFSANSAPSAAHVNPDTLTVVPLRHPLRLAAIMLVATAFMGIAYAVLTNPDLHWPLVRHYMFNPTILDGLKTTIILTVVIMICAVILGTIVALMMLSPSPLLSVPGRAYIWLFRGAPALVQIILWYNLSLVFKSVTLWIPGVGTIFSIPMNDIMSPITAGIIALSLHESGYMAEIIRGGLKAVPKGQSEAAGSLGMKPTQVTRRIIFPQAMRLIIPPTGNEVINLLKMTSLLSVIAVPDLLYSAQTIYTRTFETMPLLLVVTSWYLVIVSVLTVLQYRLELHFSRDERSSKPSYFSIFKTAFVSRRGGQAA